MISFCPLASCRSFSKWFNCEFGILKQQMISIHLLFKTGQQPEQGVLHKLKIICIGVRIKLVSDDCLISCEMTQKFIEAIFYFNEEKKSDLILK